MDRRYKRNSGCCSVVYSNTPTNTFFLLISPEADEDMQADIHYGRLHYNGGEWLLVVVKKSP